MSYRALVIVLLIIGATAVAIRPKQKRPDRVPASAHAGLPVSAPAEPAPRAPAPPRAKIPDPQPAPKPPTKPEPTAEPQPNPESLDVHSKLVRKQADRIQKMCEKIESAYFDSKTVSSELEKYRNGFTNKTLKNESGATLELYSDPADNSIARTINLADGTQAIIYFNSKHGIHSYTASHGRRIYQVKFFENEAIEMIMMPNGSGNDQTTRVWTETGEFLPMKTEEP